VVEESLCPSSTWDPDPRLFPLSPAIAVWKWGVLPSCSSTAHVLAHGAGTPHEGRTCPLWQLQETHQCFRNLPPEEHASLPVLVAVTTVTDLLFGYPVIFWTTRGSRERGLLPGG
jgi:hypothetical protein